MSGDPTIAPFFHAASGSWSYVVHQDHDAVVIDPVLDYDAASGCIRTDSARQLLDYISSHALKLHYSLETHAHADHLTAAAFLRARTGATLAIGRGIRTVQAHFAEGLQLTDDALANAFDRLLEDGDVLEAGVLRIEVLATPGHTPDGLSYRVGHDVFVGDTLFAPDIGTARCDFPGGSVAQLHTSIGRLHALPADTVLWLCHDYPPSGRTPRASVGVLESRQDNRMLPARMSLSEFSAARSARDAMLPAPALLYPALQVNLRGGRLPPAENGRRFLRTPVTLVAPADGLVVELQG
jgi:glyoxylase-like metal-dependent hydrolase (beta-lactamase superfamily II)